MAAFKGCPFPTFFAKPIPPKPFGAETEPFLRVVPRASCQHQVLPLGQHCGLSSPPCAELEVQAWSPFSPQPQPQPALQP